MTYDTTSPPVRVIDIVSREPEPVPDAAAPLRRGIAVHPWALLGCPPYAHPLALRGWPSRAVPAAGTRRPVRRRFVLRRRAGAR